MNLNSIKVKLLKAWYKHKSKTSHKAFCKFLRLCGFQIGDNVFMHPQSFFIDYSRPSLISIGNNCYFNKNVTILTHDWVTNLFLQTGRDFVNSSGKVSIGNNVNFGQNVTILKGVTIGDNCFIGIGSVVTHDIPANSVAAGCPCKVICSLEEYYQKRKKQGLAEAVEYVNCFIERFGRQPEPHEMTEEFIYFVNADNVEEYEKMGVPVRKQLGTSYASFLNCPPPFQSFNEFIAYCVSHKNYES